MFNDQIECYEAIANEIVDISPKGWKRVELTADQIGESSLNTRVVFIFMFGKRKSATNVIMIPRFLFELAKMVSTPDKGECMGITFEMDNKGNFDVSFEYE